MSICFLAVVACWIPAAVETADYTYYHRCVNRAEDALVANRVDSAYRYYDEAFASYPFIFAKDALIAAQLSCRHGNLDRAKRYLLIGAHSGLTAACMETCALLRPFSRSPAARGVADSMAAANSAFRNRTDTALADEWRRRYTEEQTLKNQNFEAYRLTVRANIAALHKLLLADVYPGDKRTGPGDNCGVLANCDAFYSLAHYDCAAATFGDLLWKAVLRGELHPRDYAALYAFDRLRAESVPYRQRTNHDCKPTLAPRKFNTAWFHEADPASRTEAAQNRQRYLICSERTDSAKKELECTDGYKLFFSYR